MNTDSTKSAMGHNVGGERIRSFLERGQRLAEDAKAIREEAKEMWSEARGEGFDVKVLKRLLKMMGEDKAKRDEEQEILDLYADAAGVEI